MNFSNRITDKKIIANSSSKIFSSPEEKYSSEYIDSHNAALDIKKDKAGGYILLYKKFGFIAIIVAIILKIVKSVVMNYFFATGQSLSNGYVVANTIISIPLSIATICSVAWVVLLLCFFLSPLHCDKCDGFFSKEKVFEKLVPNMEMSFVENRTVKKEIKNNKGETIGRIDDTEKVNVQRKGYYTVFRCKKCNHLVAELIIKQFES